MHHEPKYHFWQFASTIDLEYTDEFSKPVSQLAKIL